MAAIIIYIGRTLVSAVVCLVPSRKSLHCSHKETKKEIVFQEQEMETFKKESNKKLREVRLKWVWLKAKLSKKAYDQVCRLEGEMSTPPKPMGCFFFLSGII